MACSIKISDAILSDIHHLSNIERVKKKRGLSEIWKYSISSRDGSLQKTNSKVIQIARWISGRLRLINRHAYRQKLETAFFYKYYGRDNGLSDSQRNYVLLHLKNFIGKDQINFMTLLNHLVNKSDCLNDEELSKYFNETLKKENKRDKAQLKSRLEEDQNQNCVEYKIEIDGKAICSKQVSQDDLEIKRALGEGNEHWHDAVLLLSSQKMIQCCSKLAPHLELAGKQLRSQTSTRVKFGSNFVKSSVQIRVVKNSTDAQVHCVFCQFNVSLKSDFDQSRLGRRFKVRIGEKVLYFSEQSPLLILTKNPEIDGFVISRTSTVLNKDCSLPEYHIHF